MPDSVGGEAWRTMQRLLFEGLGHDLMARACAEAGTAPGAVKALIHLSPDVPTPMRDIAAHFGIDASYVTSLVDDLEKHGLAERRAHPTDRRIKTVALTDAGVEAQRRVAEVMSTPPPCFDALNAAEKRSLRDLMLKLAAADPRLAAAQSESTHPVGAGRR
ncbi:MAG: MarR family winged helix-turn-helix transcriptional regulator [Acidimicrobiales bacterium]